jgi:tetratricopeptide (TPR) repeat protein
VANPNHYEILGVTVRATAKEIKDAYRALARQYHPDLNPQNSESVDNFRRINEAYRVLADTEQRSHYDYMNFEPDNNNSKNTNSSNSKSANQDAEIYYSQGLMKSQIRNYAEAIKDYSRAIAINQNYADAYNKRGLCYYKLYEPSEAIKDFTKALYLDSNIPDAYYNRGMAKFDLGYPQAAVEDYTQALKLKYNYGQAYYGRGVSYSDLNNKRAAIADLQKAAQIFAQQGDNFNYKLAVEEIRRESRNFGIGNLFADVCVSLTSPILNPMGGMRSAYARLSRNNAIGVGIIFAIIFDLCFATGNYISILQVADYVKVSFSILLVIGAIAWLSFAISAFLVRHLFQGKGNWIGDLFVVGAGLLPIGYLSLIVAVMVFVEINNIYLLTVLMLFGACYFILILYSGCHQILRIPEAIATLAVPTIILLCGGLLAFAVPPLISLGFFIP